ncbi:MAG: MFS family permease [Pontimonas sp.]|jgi:MFS family permease
MTDATDALDVPALQRKVRRVLITGQIMAGLGLGATLSMGAILAGRLSGSDAWSGLAASVATLGAALAAIPLARLASRHGRRVSLTTGALVAALGAVVTIASVVVALFPLLLLGLTMMGVGTAVNLQSRFAATDLAAPKTRGRDLSLVVWATTLGAVSGPNLLVPGEALGAFLGLPELAGPFVFSLIAQLLAASVYIFALRPDPLKLAADLARNVIRATRGGVSDVVDNPVMATTAIMSVALTHATMVSVMAMTPVHLVNHGASLAIVGFTISLHIAGMYGLSPVFGLIADRAGRIPTILLGQAILVLSLAFTGFGSENEVTVVIGLVLLGLGWSASTVAGSTLLTESTSIAKRASRQGLSDLLMSGSGAVGGALAGVVLSLVGYSGLSFVALALVVAVLVRVFTHSGASPRRSVTGVPPATYDI